MSVVFDYAQYLATSAIATGSLYHEVDIPLSGEYQTIYQGLYNPGFTADLNNLDIAIGFKANLYVDVSDNKNDGVNLTRNFDYKVEIRPFNQGQGWQTLVEKTGITIDAIWNPAGSGAHFYQTDPQYTASGDAATSGGYIAIGDDDVYVFTSGEDFAPMDVRLQIKSSTDEGTWLTTQIYASGVFATQLRCIGSVDI